MRSLISLLLASALTTLMAGASLSATAKKPPQAKKLDEGTCAILVRKTGNYLGRSGQGAAFRAAVERCMKGESY